MTSDNNFEALKQIIIKPKLLSKTGFPDCSSRQSKIYLLAPMGHQTQFTKWQKLKHAKEPQSQILFALLYNQNEIG